MKSERGQSLVEFAIILPVIILLLLGILDFGRVFHAYLTIDHAGREAARAGSIGGLTLEEIGEVAVGSASGINLVNSHTEEEETPVEAEGKSKGSVQVKTVEGSSGKKVEVEISYEFDLLTLDLLAPDVIKEKIFGEDFKLTDTTVMRVE